eukprot:311334-Rhodomonas_salina.2
MVSFVGFRGGVDYSRGLGSQSGLVPDYPPAPLVCLAPSRPSVRYAASVSEPHIEDWLTSLPTNSNRSW